MNGICVKSENNTQKRNLPFELAIYLFDGPVIQHVDDRQDYGEVRIRAIGIVADPILHCVYTDRADTRRIISLLAMALSLSTCALAPDVDLGRHRPIPQRSQPSDREIDAQVAEDGDAWSDEELAEAELVYPPPTPDQVRTLRNDWD